MFNQVILLRLLFNDVDNMSTTQLLQYDSKSHTLFCQGEWDIHHLNLIDQQFKVIYPQLKNESRLNINGQSINKMDTAGAYILIHWQNKLIDLSQPQLELQAFTPEANHLITLITEKIRLDHSQKPLIKTNYLSFLGQQTYQYILFIIGYFNFIGSLAYDAFHLIKKRRFLRINILTQVIYQCGYQALPIIALLSIMIGIVIAYQMGLQLKTYGANIFIVDLLGLSILREFAPLLTAIMIAGRTGSAFTAELGMMKLNQEIDALKTMGITPSELLILPRMIGLLISLPLITMWANIFGILGGIIMATHMLHLSWYDFLNRFPNVIPLKTLLIGLGKTPIFALIIASVGCYQGMQVKISADSIGDNTTKSVVISIFLILSADALFSIIFSWLNL